jgi:hypothetical protein
MRRTSFAMIIAAVAAAVSWGVTVAAVWLPVDERALPPVHVTAVTSGVALIALASVRWLSGRAMNYLLDAMLTQRAQTRPPAKAPLRAIR